MKKLKKDLELEIKGLKKYISKLEKDKVTLSQGIRQADNTKRKLDARIRGIEQQLLNEKEVFVESVLCLKAANQGLYNKLKVHVSKERKSILNRLWRKYR